jgi:hypothetical protein
MCKYCNSRGLATGNVNACVAPGTSTVGLPPKIDNYEPCQNSPYAKLPAGLRKTLGDTFVAIETDAKDSEGRKLTDNGQLGLQNTAKGLRVDTWDALDNIPSSLINVYRLVYDRVIALLPSLWDNVAWIRWTWISSSLGFGVIYKDPATAKTAYTGAATSTNANGRAICFEDRKLSWYFHKDCDCWRELPPTPEDAKRDPEGLHLLVGDRPGNPGGDSVHIDPIDPYKFRNEDGTCHVTMDSDTIEHLKQVFGSHQILSPFNVLPDLLKSVQGDLNTNWAQGMDAEKTEVAGIADSWAKEERFQAVLGKPGWQYFQAKVDRLNAIRKKLDGMRPAPAGQAPAVTPAAPPPPPS